jgi:hypothetical protein
MAEDRETPQEQEWGLLYDQLVVLLQNYGANDAFRRGDYWLLDDNWSLHQHSIEIQNLEMLRAPIIRGIRELLTDFPDWEIVISVDVPGTERVWPKMGLVIRTHEIVDGLQRQYLPEAFRSLRYDDSRRLFDED